MARSPCKIGGCFGPVKGYGWCAKHYARWRNHGDPLAVPDRRRNGELQALLRAASQATTDDCIMVTGRKTRPVTDLPGQSTRKGMNASRAVWIIAHGDPGDAFVLHTCHQGVEGCVNIRHLYLGNQAQNGRDMAAGGKRKGIVTARGEACNRAKLTPVLVREIRQRHADGESQTSLGKAFGVSQVAISCIVLGKTWRHVA